MSDTANHLPLIGKNALSLEAETTQGRIRLPGDDKSKWVIFFGNPAKSIDSRIADESTPGDCKARPVITSAITLPHERRERAKSLFYCY